jgi:hypothetical protein
MPDTRNYPADDKWYVRSGRFLNVLDPEVNMLSPTRLQAWAATFSAFAGLAHDFLSTASTAAGAVTNSVTSIAGIVWAHYAHKSYNEAKRINIEKKVNDQ